MDAIIQGHMSKGKSMKFITSFSTLSEFMEPASNVNPQIIRGGETVDCRGCVVH